MGKELLNACSDVERRINREHVFCHSGIIVETIPSNRYLADLPEARIVARMSNSGNWLEWIG